MLEEGPEGQGKVLSHPRLTQQLTNTTHQGCPYEVCLAPCDNKLCSGLGKCDRFIFQFMLANKMNVPLSAAEVVANAHSFN